MQIGSYLRARREKATLSVAQVVADLRVPRQTVYMWESTRSKIDPVDIRRLLTHYGCRPDQIAYALALRSGDPDAVDPDQDAALDNPTSGAA